MLKPILLLGSFVAMTYTAQIPHLRNSTITPKRLHVKELAERTDYKPLITPQLSDSVVQSIKVAQVPGLSLGVVHVDLLTKDVKTEFGAWGYRTEEGDNVTEERSVLQPYDLFGLPT